MATSKVSIRRGSDAGSSIRSAHLVDLPAATTVLRALMVIAAEQDPSLAFRIHRCYRGTCGSCSVEVNGRVVRACRRLIGDGEAIEVGPDPRHPVIRDLVVDFSQQIENRRNQDRNSTGEEDT